LDDGRVEGDRTGKGIRRDGRGNDPKNWFTLQMSEILKIP